MHRTALGPWLVTRWEDVHRLLREPGTSVDDRSASNCMQSEAALMEELGIHERDDRGNKAILNIDPPDHTPPTSSRVQGVHPARTIEGLRPRIESLVDGLLHDAAAQPDGDEPFDVIAGLAFPLPFAVISEMLGMPESQDLAQLRAWSHTLVQVLDPILFLTKADEILDASDHVIEVVRSR